MKEGRGDERKQQDGRRQRERERKVERQRSRESFSRQREQRPLSLFLCLPPPTLTPLKRTDVSNAKQQLLKQIVRCTRKAMQSFKCLKTEKLKEEIEKHRGLRKRGDMRERRPWIDGTALISGSERKKGREREEETKREGVRGGREGGLPRERKGKHGTYFAGREGNQHVVAIPRRRRAFSAGYYSSVEDWTRDGARRGEREREDRCQVSSAFQHRGRERSKVGGASLVYQERLGTLTYS